MTQADIDPRELRARVRKALRTAEAAILSGDLNSAEKWWAEAKERAWKAAVWQAFVNGRKEGGRRKR